MKKKTIVHPIAEGDAQHAVPSGGMRLHVAMQGGINGGLMGRQEMAPLLVTPVREDSRVTAAPTVYSHQSLGNGCYRTKRQPGC